jgi:hypothetical protein
MLKKIRVAKIKERLDCIRRGWGSTLWHCLTWSRALKSRLNFTPRVFLCRPFEIKWTFYIKAFTNFSTMLGKKSYLALFHRWTQWLCFCAYYKEIGSTSTLPLGVKPQNLGNGNTTSPQDYLLGHKKAVQILKSLSMYITEFCAYPGCHLLHK